MTSVLSKDKEQELIEQMASIQNQIKEREKAYESNEEVKNAVKELREAKEKAEAYHREVSGTLRRPSPRTMP